MVIIQTEDFSVEREHQLLRQHSPGKTGAICTFVGLVREFGDRPGIQGMFLEHYPGMTEKSLNKLIQKARETWDIHEAKVIHRIGTLKLDEQIVFVGVSSAHRSEAFAACEFIMDYLKTDAPFWKKELSASGSAWVDAKASDQNRKQKWADLTKND